MSSSADGSARISDSFANSLKFTQRFLSEMNIKMIKL